MILLIVFAFLGGIVTILSPCILPVLPIVLSSSLTGGKKRPFGIITGFILSFTFFTLFLTSLVKAFGISADVLRNISVVIIALFGLSLLVPQFQAQMEKLFSRLANLVPAQSNNQTANRSDFIAGVLIGLSLGLIWTPCVGPILASIIALAATSKVTSDAIIITLAYSIGTAIPLMAITYGGRKLLAKAPALIANTSKIQKAFGLLMIATALLIYLQLDRTFQTYILEKFPSYGTGLTKIEDNQTVRNALSAITNPGEVHTNGLIELVEDSMGKAPELVPGGEWFNSKPLTLMELRGKVVLLDFWTYTCINCIRTLPYIKNWNDKYKDKGLVIIGIHSPEFEFEKNAGNVEKAIKDFDIGYPVVQDNNFATWTAYSNQYWPAEYLIDAKGVIRHTHFGEGNYDESEQWIQKLLNESGASISNMPVSNTEYKVYAQTPETYVGMSRMSNFGSPEHIIPDKEISYSFPKNIDKDTFAFSGPWTVSDERSSPSTNSLLTFHFNAQQVYLVMLPKNEKIPGKIQVLLDGRAVDSSSAGDDVKDGMATVDTDRLYKLIKLKTPGDHILKLKFFDNNLELYVFTFG
jgi:cytochrome c biogenesis protein CcdA/thiol-disulfide isomerase/thioredoxin